MSGSDQFDRSTAKKKNGLLDQLKSLRDMQK